MATQQRGGDTAAREIRRPTLGGADVPWQTFGEEFSFGSTSRQTMSGLSDAGAEAPSARSNDDARSTGGIQALRTPDFGPASLPQRDFGRTAWSPVRQWDGVVQAVSGDMFEARLVPIVAGVPDLTQTEFAEFGMDELWAPESDRELVQPGSVFYWTVGLRRDRPGTQSYSSLIRFRRLAPPSKVRQRLAAEEADRLLGKDVRE